MGAVIWFDLGPPVNFNDDAVYQWPLLQVVAGHGFRVFPFQKPAALVGEVWGLVFSLGHPDLRLLRLSLLPFIGLAAERGFRLARLFGADRFWSSLAAVVLLGAPVYLAVSTSFMTDTAYVALLLAACVAFVRWLRDGRSIAAAIVWTSLAALQRQHAIALVVAFTIALFIERRHREVRREEWLGLDLLILVVGAAELLPVVTRLLPSPGYLGNAGPISAISAAASGSSQHLGQPARLQALLFLPQLMGSLVAPLGLGLVLAAARFRRWGLLVASLLLAAPGAFLLVCIGTLFPGDYLNPSGLGPPHVAGLLSGAGPGLVGLDSYNPGVKPQLFPLPVFALLEAVALLAAVAAAWWAMSQIPRRAGGSEPRLRVESAVVFVLLVCLAHLAALVPSQTIDRYGLPAAAPLVALLAAGAAKAPRQTAARAWAIGVVLVGIAVYVAGQQDYEAWQVARDKAAQLAYRTASPAKVDAGWDANLRYLYLPAYERGHLFDVSDIEQAPYRLVFARVGDPRPGYDYASLASGRIVIASR